MARIVKQSCNLNEFANALSFFAMCQSLNDAHTECLNSKLEMFK